MIIPRWNTLYFSCVAAFTNLLQIPLPRFIFSSLDQAYTRALWLRNDTNKNMGKKTLLFLFHNLFTENIMHAVIRYNKVIKIFNVFAVTLPL